MTLLIDQFVIILDLTMYPYIFRKNFQISFLCHIYGLMCFPQVVSLENQSIMTREEVFLRGLFELVTG